MIRPLNMSKYHVIYGRHSNIPDCCIAFFIKDWPKIFRSSVEYAIHDGKQRATEKRIGKKFGYRPCLDCMRRGHWHKIHSCFGPCANFSVQLRIVLEHEEARRG